MKYKLLLTAWLYSLALPAVSATHLDEAKLDALQRQAFDYFLDCRATNGLVPLRLGDPRLTSPQAEGLHLSALIAGTGRGWLKRPEAARLAAQTLSTCARLPRIHGFFRESYSIHTLEPLPAQSRADFMGTAALIAGALTCEQFFDRETPTENTIRETARQLYAEAEWNWMLRDNEGESGCTPALYWSEDGGYSDERADGSGSLQGMLACLLAAGAPAHSIPAACWNKGWARGYQWEHISGADLVVSPPLFSQIYPQIWLDLKNRRDRHTDYWRNAFHAVRLNYRYCTSRLYPGTALWGLSTCEGPKGIDDYGCPPLQGHVDEDAVLAPAAAISAIGWAPSEALAMVEEMETNHREAVWGKYGPRASFSPRHNWVSRDYLATDLGAMVCMIENHRSGLVRDLFSSHDAVRRALADTGFTGVIADFEEASGMEPYLTWESSSTAMQKIAADISREGFQSLEVVCRDRTGMLAGRSALRDFQPFRYLTLWLSSGSELDIALEDSGGRSVQLAQESAKGAEDGWTRHVYSIEGGECDLTDVRRILFTFHPQRPGDPLWMDGIFLAAQKPGPRPEGIQNLRAESSRMPGEAVLRWDPPADDVFTCHARYSARPIRDYESFQKATAVSTAPFRHADPARAEIHVPNLVPGETYHFAVQTETLDHEKSENTAVTSLTLPRTKAPDEFLVDHFDSGGILNWRPAGTGTEVAADTGNALLGSGGSLRIGVSDAKKASKASAYADTDFRDFSQYGYLALWVSGKTAIQIALANEKGDTEYLPEQKTALADGWSPVFFDLAGIRKLDRKTISRILIHVRPDTESRDRGIWVDSLRLTKTRN
ncbi:MAG TPA: glucoamylase family protein [Kiritimatiellia bacterium]|nr:glucoamylase family protein [Kiritimatiellia bacterium]